MKKIFLITVMLFAFVSCSDDDSAPKTQSMPLVSKMTVTVSGEPDWVYDIIYDTQNRIEKVITNGNTTMRYTYTENNYISTIFYGDVPQFVFHYNGQNIITHYTYEDNGQMNAVNYDAASNTYRFPPESFTLNSHEDVSVENGRKINYTASKGVFANVTGKNIHLMNRFVGIFWGVASKMGIQDVKGANNEKVFEMETKYNDAGYPIQIDITNFFGSPPTKITLAY